jgi:hypothetical protein
MVYGPDTIHQLITESGWSYPVSVRRLEQEHALTNVQLDEKGRSIMLAELLMETNIDRFEDRTDLQRKLEPVFEREIDSRRIGIIGRVKRSLLGKGR